jgi:hypothetical protein
MKVIYKSSFHLDSKLMPCDLQDPFEHPQESLTDPVGEDVADFFIRWE